MVIWYYVTIILVYCKPGYRRYNCHPLTRSPRAVTGQVLGIVYRCIATHLIKKASFSCKTAQTGAITLIQRFGSALNLNIHLAWTHE